MKQNKILNKVYDKKTSVLDAYHKLFGHKRKCLRQSHFIKVQIIIIDSWFVTTLLWLFTLIPLPVGFVKRILKKTKVSINQIPLNLNLMEVISVKPVYVEVITENAYINIKTI